ncbi:unnamed protein product [Gadus morhua 'NCC']
MSPKQSLPTTSRASGGQANGAGAGPKKTTSPNTSCEFYNTYTNVYAPVVIDSSSSDVEEVDYSQVEDRFKDGLATLNLFNALEQHPSLFLPYLVYSAEDLKAETLEALFRPQMSPTDNGGGVALSEEVPDKVFL